MISTTPNKLRLQSFFDNEYWDYQNILITLIDNVPKITINSLSDERALIAQLVIQNKSYAKKIIDLFEELSKQSFVKSMNENTAEQM